MADDGRDKDPEEEELDEGGELDDEERDPEEERDDAEDFEGDEELDDDLGEEELDEDLDDEDELGDEDLDDDEALEVAAELEEEVSRLKLEVTKLEGALEDARGTGPVTRWSTWILGTLAAAFGLVLAVVFLGQGFPIPRDCPEADPVGIPAAGHEDALYALLNDHADELQTCFDSWAAGSKARPGTIIRTLIEVEAGEGGAVSTVTVSGEDVPASFGGCLREAVSGWTFPTEGQFALEAPFEVRGSGGSPGGGDGGTSSDGGDASSAPAERADGAPPSPSSE